MTKDTKIDVYQRVTDRIVAELEAGTKPWHKPWTSLQSTPVLSMPQRHSGEAYKGVNVILLWMTSQSMGYRSNIWMTFKQALEYGAAVRKGEKGTLVVFADRMIKTEKNSAGEDVDRAIPFMKGYTVFNVDQIDGLPARFEAPADAPAAPAAIFQQHDSAETLIAASGATIRHGGDRAFYMPSQDLIQMPMQAQFHSPADYYATLLHELTHWTKHETRLARELGRKSWGDEGYAAEELVAELGAAFLCAQLGVQNMPLENHASYVASWLKVLKGDKRAVFQAASLAQKAADFLLARLEAPAPAPIAAPIITAPELEPVLAAAIAPRPVKPRIVITAAMQRGDVPMPFAAPPAAPALVAAPELEAYEREPVGRKPRAIPIGGVKVQPKWAWSAQYRRETIAALTERAPRSRADQNAAYLQTLSAYAIWLARRDGFTVPSAATVRFAGSSEAPNVAIIIDAGRELARIDIPNPGRVYDAGAPGYGLVTDEERQIAA